MNLKGSPFSSKLLICVKNLNFNVSGTNPTDIRAYSWCSNQEMTPMVVFCWQCIQQT